MSNDVLTKVLLLIVGAFAGAIGSAFKSYLDRRAELKKSNAAMRREHLDPLRIAARDLRATLDRIQVVLNNEKEIPESDLKESYNLRFWFKRCKDYIVDSALWTDEARRRDIAMHSGGLGTDAMSTLYITACYLYYATRIRLKVPYIDLRGGDEQLIRRLEAVRSDLSNLDFYSVTQDSTGVSMRNSVGEVMNYREFCEALTNTSQSAWFMTLADVYFKLHGKNQENVKRLITSLDDLVTFLERRSVHF